MTDLDLAKLKSSAKKRDAETEKSIITSASPVRNCKGQRGWLECIVILAMLGALVETREI